MDYTDDRELGTRNCVDLSGSHRTLRERHVIKGPARSLFTQPSENQQYSTNPNQLCHSSSSIELLHALRDHSIPRRNDPRRASSSHGPFSLTTPSSPAKINDSFFAMLQDYQPAVLGVKGTDQRSPGPAEFMQGRVMHATPFINQEPESNATQADPAPANTKRTRDPKVKNKLHRFLVQTKSKTEDNIPGLLSSSLLTKTNSTNDDATAQCFTTTTHRTFMSSVDMEEQQRQRIFAHYDCQSLAANLSYRKLRGLLNGKATNSNSSSLKTLEATTCDTGNKHAALERLGCTELLEHCPHFCSEVGGEIDHLVCLTGATPSKPNSLVHRPPNSYTVSILESLPNEALWRVGSCPFQCDPCPIEAVDYGAHYYRRHFHTQKHENWFGIDEQLGPLAVSIKKEKLQDNSGTEQRHQHPRYQFRMIIRTSELLTLRGIVQEDSIQSSRSGKSLTSKELLEYVAPEIQMSCLRLGVNTSNCEEQLLKLDEQSLTSKYKVGILYCRSGQSSEEDMYNNEDAGPAFIEFLETIGKRVRLKGFQHYKAGLDNKTDSTGTHSVYTVYKDCEIMFHVSTMLPFTPNNRQQLLRKRHIGNDIVTIVFQEPGALPFSPQNIRSQFQHVFLIVRAINPCTDNTTYRVAISRSKEVPVFGPPLPADALFSKNKMFTEFVLAKIINAENAAHLSEKFANLAARTRKEYLKDLCINYCTNMYLDAGNKFSIFPSKKKEKPKIRFSGDISQRGAICWQIMFQDHGSSIAVDCVLGISAETFVIIEEYSKQIIFVTPTRSILGWSTSDNALRIFYHNGECITINMRFYGELDEQLEVIERLRAVTLGNGVMELSIRRNMMGQLGFHVQPDGIVTQVDSTGQAWAAGMRRGYRLVEVCKIVVATLSYREMIDLLKTSAQLTFIVIKSFSDGTPRRGCFNKHCKLNFLSVESENEVSRFSNGYPEPECMNVKSLLRNGTIQHPAPNYKRFYDQNLFPHKTASRITYHTGSSTALTNGLQEDYKQRLHHSGSSSAITNGQCEDYRSNLPSSNSVSPQLCNNDKWYDVLEETEQKQNTQHITLSLQRQYNSRTFDHPRLEESTSLPVNLNTSPLSFSNCSSSQSSQQGDTLNYSRQSTDSSKLLSKHRCSKYEITEFKCLTISPNDNGTADMSIRTHNHMAEQQKPFEEKAPTIGSTSPYKSSMSSVQKADLHGAVLPSTSSVKTAKLLPSITNFNQSSNTHRNISNYSRSSTLRRDLLELIGPTSTSSHYDSLKVKRNSTVDRVSNPQATENGTTFLTTDLKQEPGALPFSPQNIRSQFQHVFLIVRAINPCTDNTTYRVAISRSKEVPVFGPPLPADALFSKNKMFTEFVLAKIINAENAAHLSEKFANLAARTRKEYLKDLCINYCTNMYLDAGNKFSIFPSKKKEKPKIRFSGDISQRGAICWQIMFQDHGSSIAVDCVLGISAETFVIIEEYSKQIIFVTPTRSILGWSTSDNALRIFYHNGECITINMRFYGELDEQLEVIERLRAVTLGNGVMELSIRRNMMGQLGFHVQPDGIVTQVDSTGQAWAAGMRRGYRLVEVCKIVVATLSYREMIDLLKTSAQLTFIVIKSFSDGTPRRGCFNKHCKLNFLSVESENEVSRFSNGYPEPECMNVKSLLRNGTIQHPAPNYKRFYDQNLFPHKTASRITYHTGSSTALTNGLQEDYKQRLHHSGSSSAITNGQCEDYRPNLPSSNSVSPQLCNNDKWYDVLEETEQKQNTQHITLSLQRQYNSRTFDHPRLEESTSLPVNLNTSPLSFSNCSSSQSSQQGDTLNYSRQSTDSSKLLSKHRCSKYEITEFKCLTISPNDNGTADMSIRTHNHMAEQQKPFEEKAPTIGSTSPYKSSMSSVQKADLHGAVLPSTSSVKTAKLLPSITNFNQSSNTHRNISNYSRSSTLRRDLLELIGPTSTSSHYDSLKVKRNSTVDRVSNPQATENGTTFLTTDLKQVGMQQAFEDSNDIVRNSFASIRPAIQINLDHSGKSLTQEIPRINGTYSKIRDVSRRAVQDDLSVNPPLLPDAKKLDWTTLVDTATKAIVLQLRDDKTLSLCNSADDEKRETGSNLQESKESFPLQFNCTPKLKSQLSDFITDF